MSFEGERLVLRKRLRLHDGVEDMVGEARIIVEGKGAESIDGPLLDRLIRVNQVLTDRLLQSNENEITASKPINALSYVV